jgi:aryl-alcohol dehydrogenase-like predicted oxidoreductase
MSTTNPPAGQAGSYRVGDLDLNRIGYGAMQLAGPGVFGPPRDRAAAIELLRTAVELGVNHIDTADAYGPSITNEIIREAPVACVQNFYNIASRADAAVLAATAGQHIAYVPYFPLGGFSPLQSDMLESVAHLRENIAGAALTLPADAIAELDAI